jgi:hypothetical protein
MISALAPDWTAACRGALLSRFYKPFTGQLHGSDPFPPRIPHV